MNAIDSRVQSAEAMLTGPRLLAGHGEGLVRVPGVGRLLGVSIWQRAELVAWIEAQGLWVEPPFAGPLSQRPLAGCVDIEKLRAALVRGLAEGGLPFTHNLEVAQ